MASIHFYTITRNGQDYYADCPHGCHHQKPYGWVVMADCPIHDPLDTDEHIGFDHITGLTYCAHCGAEWEAFRGGEEWHENDCFVVTTKRPWNEQQ